MRHNLFKAKDTSFKVITTTDTAIAVWTFTTADGLTEQDSVTPSAINDDYYKAVISTASTDCFMLMKHDGECGIMRVGDPEVLTIGYTGETGETHTHVQYDMDGEELGNGDMIEIGEGFYYAEPASLESSFVVLMGTLVKNLEVPYMVVEVEGSGGIEGDKQFLNTGYNTFGALADKHSYFDLEQGKWIQDDDRIAKASDLAMAVCHKYGLVWDDEDDDQWIGNYVKYVRSYDENDGAKKFRLYKPSKTPLTNDANFDLHVTDEDGNYWVRGVALLLLQTLETINDTDGAIITYKEV